MLWSRVHVSIGVVPHILHIDDVNFLTSPNHSDLWANVGIILATALQQSYLTSCKNSHEEIVRIDYASIHNLLREYLCRIMKTYPIKRI